MDLFKTGLKSVLGGPAGANEYSGGETVEKLVDRVQTSTLLEDRRDACRALRALAKQFRVEVGAQGMSCLIQVLDQDRSDSEIISYALDALTDVICGGDDMQSCGDLAHQSRSNLGEQFTEIYIKQPQNVGLLLDIVEEFDFKVRLPALRLLTGLLVNRPKDVQEIVLVIPRGVARLMDLLADTREVIRNDALLLLSHLTRSNANIQKIVAFEDGFERLLSIIHYEGYSDGGVVVEDCLTVLLNLLKNNTSNQNFFQEGSFVQRLAPFFQLESDVEWSNPKVTNFCKILQLVRALVSPDNPVNVTSACQKTINACGLLEHLSNLLMTGGVPADILTETINTVAEVIRGCQPNQEYFATLNAPSVPPKSALVVLLLSMINEKQQFALRLSVLYCFECFLYKNELGQARVVQTLLPATSQVSELTSGQLLCGGLFSPEPLSAWLSAVALSHALVNNPTQKEQMLRVQLATAPGQPPTPLMRQVANILQQGGQKVQTRVGLLMFLCTWLAHCRLAVAHFLSIPTNVPYLTSQVSLPEGDDHEDIVQGLCAFLLGICIEFNDDSIQSFSRDALHQLVVKRVGLVQFLDKLGSVPKQELYSLAAHKLQLKYKQPSDAFFDFEFCRLFKSLESAIIKCVQLEPADPTRSPESDLSHAQHSLLNQYKTVIREQDQQLTELKQQLELLRREQSGVQQQLNEANSTIQQLRDQNAVLKLQANNPLGGGTDGVFTLNGTVGSSSVGGDNGAAAAELAKARSEIEALRQQVSSLQLRASQPMESSSFFGNDSSWVELMQARGKIADLELQLSAVREQLAQEQSKHNEQQEHGDGGATTKAALSALFTKNGGDSGDLFDQHDTVQRLTDEVRRLTKLNETLQTDLEGLRSSHEDLLVMFTEQDSTLQTYRKRLRELGEKIEEDDEDEEDDYEEVQLDALNEHGSLS